MFDFFDALITQQTSPEEAYRKFDELSNKTAEALRKLTKQVCIENLWIINNYYSHPSNSHITQPNLQKCQLMTAVDQWHFSPDQSAVLPNQISLICSRSVPSLPNLSMICP